MATTTQTTTHMGGSIRLKGASETEQKLPTSVIERISSLPKLSREQAGHLRHFHNLASQLDGDWAYFGTQDPGQEWLDAIRYQLAIMSYAAAAAHFHRLPALRGAMRELFQNLIRKMLRREVWSYWYLTSQSGILVDPDIKELRKPWADPVKDENIMYSGHLLLMVSVYEMLFDSNHYEREGSITFNWDPIFWGLGPEKFEYSRKSLQDVILNQMEKNGWVGVCCEPNMVFVVCNQFPLTAIRFADVHNGTGIINDVLPKYKAAIEQKSMISNDGWFADAYRPKQDQTLPAREVAFTAWGATRMNGWNSEQVHAMFPSQALGTLTKREDGRVNVERPDVAAILREKALSGEGNPDEESTRQEAIKEANSKPAGPGFPYGKPYFGHTAGWVSEVGPPEMLSGMLMHATMFLRPSWNKGGLYYPRCDDAADEEGNWRLMDPVTGNAAIGYSRLNVPDGQKLMWEHAWTPEKVRGAVAIENVSFSEGVDFLRCKWVTESENGFTGLVVTVRTWNGETATTRPKITALPSGRYDIFVDGNRVKTHIQEGAEDLQLEIEVSSSETDLCILSK